MAVMLANASMPGRSSYLNNPFDSIRKLHAWSSSSSSSCQQILSRKGHCCVRRIAARRRKGLEGELGRSSNNGGEEERKVRRLHALGGLFGDDDEGNDAESRSKHLYRNAPPPELKSSWTRREKADSERRTEWTPSESNHRRQSFGTAAFGTDAVARNAGARGGNEDGSRARLGFRGGGAEKKDLAGEQRRAAFEAWARHKFREAGNPALSAIEEMRQTFAPGSPRLDSGRMGVSNAVESRRNADVGRQPQYNQTAGRGNFVSSPVSDGHNGGGASYGGGGDRRGSRVDRNSSPGRSGFGAVGRSEQYVARSSTMSGSWSPKSPAPNRKRGVQFSAEESGLASGGESTSSARRSDASPSPQPMLVKRNTKFPINWFGRAGTVMLVDKPQGWTSFAVCAKLRYLLKIQKVGHAGTLDPMATGLLIVCLGKATKLADSYQAMTKVYSGTIRLGELTPSLDSFTEVSDVLPWEQITDEQLEQAKQEFVGDIFQTPPMYSAIKIDGERLYAKARRGEQIEVPARLITVIDFQLERSSESRQDVHFRVTCSKGTYIRSLCADLARAVGSYGHLTALRREKIGTYSVKDAWPILEFMEQYSQTSDSVVVKAGA